MFPTNSEQHFWCIFCLLFTGICHLPHVLTVPPTKACLLCATLAGMDLHIQVHACRHLPNAVHQISEDCLLSWLKKATMHRASVKYALEAQYLSRKSARKLYPWQALKSSSNVCDTSLESLRKQNTVTNISTNSRGDKSCARCMFSTHRRTQPLSGTAKVKPGHFCWVGKMLSGFSKQKGMI